MAKAVKEVNFSGSRDAKGNITRLQYRYYLTDTAADGSEVYYDRAPRVRVFGPDEPGLTDALEKAFKSTDPRKPALEQVLAKVKAAVEAEEGV